MRHLISSLIVMSFGLISCEKKADLTENPILKFHAQRIASLEEQISLHDDQIIARDGGRKRLSDMKQALVQARLNRVEISSVKDTLEREIEQTRKEMSAYQERVKHYKRNLALGEKIAKLEVPGGRVFHEVEIQKISDVGLTVKHRDGRARIPFTSLSTELRDRFFYNSSAAEAVLAEERAARVQYESRIALHQREQRLASAKRQKEKAEEMLNTLAASPRVPKSYSSSRRASTHRSSDWRSRRYSRRSRSYGGSSYYYYNRGSRSSSYYCPTPSRRSTFQTTRYGRRTSAPRLRSDIPFKPGSIR